jgi:DNA replication protein DnaC
LERAQKEQKLAVEVLDELLAHELRQRFERRITANLQLSGLPLQERLFVLDELGFLPLSPEDASFIFELVNKRYQAHKSTIITSNKSYGQWGEIFPDPVLAVALLDRLLHHATAKVPA